MGNSNKKDSYFVYNPSNSADDSILEAPEGYEFRDEPHVNLLDGRVLLAVEKK